jgi:hypothetical protein
LCWAHLGVKEAHVEAELLLVNLPAHAVDVIIVAILTNGVQVPLLLLLVVLLLLRMGMLLAVRMALRGVVVHVLPDTADGLGGWGGVVIVLVVIFLLSVCTLHKAVEQQQLSTQTQVHDRTLGSCSHM